MAESISPALPGDVEWLPGPSGARVLRIHPATSAPPALVLRLSGGGERNLSATPGAATEYAIPADLNWTAAWLQWPDGTRAALPLPHGRHAEVIQLHPRRFARGPHVEPSPGETATSGRRAPPETIAPTASEVSAPDGAVAGVSSPDQRAVPGPTAAGGVPAPPETTTPGEPVASDISSPSEPAAPGEPAASDIFAPPEPTAPPASNVSAPDETAVNGVPAPGGRAALRPTAAPGLPAPPEPTTPDEPAVGNASAPDETAAAGASATGETAALGVSARRATPAPRDPAANDVSAPGESAVPGASAGFATPGASNSSAPDASAPADVDDAAPAWTTPPHLSDSTQEAEAAWRDRRDDLRRELSEAADAIARARDGERAARDSVLTALAAARADLRAARAAREADASLLSAVSGELEVERAAHAVTRGSVGTLADALAAARADLAANKTRAEATALELEAARAELAAARASSAAELADAHRDATQARAEIVSLRQALEGERARPAPAKADLERFAREQADAAAATARRPPEESARLLANLDAAAAALRASASAFAGAASADAVAGRPTTTELAQTEPGSPQRTPFEDAAATAPGAAEAPLAVGPSERGDARVAAAPSGAASHPGDSAVPARVVAEDSSGTRSETVAEEPSGTASESEDTIAESGAAPQPGDAGATAFTVAEASSFETPTRSTALVAASADLRLRRALVALARDDSVTAGALLVGLLPAQGAALEAVMTYDLTVRGVGTFAVFVEGSSARIVRQSRRRPRSEALFHLSAEPLVLAELLAGDRAKVGRFRRQAKVSGRRKRLSDLAPLRDARLSLAEAATAGARLEPGLVYQALPYAIDPQWTRGHSFTVAQRIVELAPHTWHISARDGLPLRVVERRTDARADAVVTMSKAAFERMLRDEPPLPADRPQIRGDREAVAALKRWTDLARS